MIVRGRLGAGIVTAIVIAGRIGVASAQTHYVAPGGSDGNDGSSPTVCGAGCGPWATVQYAVTRPGTTVQLLAGRYHEAVTITRPNLTVERHPSAAPGSVVLDATDARDAATPVAVYHAAVRILGAHHVTLRGLTISNQANQDGRINVGLEIGTRSDDVAAQAIVIEDNDFTRIDRPRTGDHRGAIAVLVYGARSGGQYATHDVVIRNNRFFRLALSDSWNANVISLTMNTRDALVAGNHVWDLDETVGPVQGEPRVTIAIEVTGNTANHPAVPSWFARPLAAEDDHARDIVVEDNLVEKTTGAQLTGFYAQGGQRILVQRNQFRGCYYGLIAITELPVTPAHYTRDVWFRDNLLTDTVKAEVIAGDASQGANPDYRPVENVLFSHNQFRSTVDDPTVYGDRVLFYPGTLGASGFVDNLVVAAKPLLYWSSAGGANTATLDHNRWVYTGTGAPPFRWAAPAIAGYAWADYRAATGQDAHSQWQTGADVTEAPARRVDPAWAAGGFGAFTPPAAN